MTGELPPSALHEIFAHAREGYPEEVCGFVLQGGEVRRCENQQDKMHALDPVTYPRTAATAYYLGPADLRFMADRARSSQPVQIIYHSHVEVGAYFSDEDERLAAWDGELVYPADYLVVDVKTDGVHGAKLFRFEGGRFLEVAQYGP
jgi:[CysO sulfur-carrier protein]-S-L-cysteine hydrolase